MSPALCSVEALYPLDETAWRDSETRIDSLHRPERHDAPLHHVTFLTHMQGSIVVDRCYTVRGWRITYISGLVSMW